VGDFMRLDKLLSMLNYGSRKAVKKLVKEGHVLVNNKPVHDASIHIDPNQDKVTVHDETVFYNDHIVIMLHKPSGFVCANHDTLHQTVFDLLNEPHNRLPLNIAGRLDIDTEGLVILSNDGKLIHSIIHPKKEVYKTYFVKTKTPVLNSENLTKPMTLLDGAGKPYEVLTPKIKQIDEKTFELQIREGKFHQVKEMFKKIGHEVTYLKRIAIHDLVLDETLEKGAYKVLSKEDIKRLMT
jgi:16S rRNA pseudouridine516 synthase